MATRQKAARQLIQDVMESADGQRARAHRSELCPGSAFFPHKLLQLHDVPKKLYALGNVDALAQPAIAIVGARKATPYGLECAGRFARIAASLGVAVVSGGAIGCDMAAHRGALDRGGTTVVVLGSGADVVYPLRARSLFLEVLSAGGLLLSEAPWGSAPLAWAFSRRNRIIAALAEATLIVEAGLPSGTFQTADHTLALGNEVLVVPGPIFAKESQGSNRLLWQGATPVVDDESFRETLKSIFEMHETPQQLTLALSGTDEGEPLQQEIQNAASEPARKPHEIKERCLTERIIASLNQNPMTIDALAQAHKADVIEVVRCITKLEISSQVERIRDGRYMTKIRKSKQYG